MNKEIIKHWLQNRWFIGIGSSIIAYFIISLLTSLFQNINLISAFGKVFLAFISFFTFKTPIWVVIVGLIVIFLVYVLLNQIKRQHILQEVTSESIKKRKKFLFNIEELASSLIEDNLDKIQEVLDNCMKEIIFNLSHPSKYPRGELIGKITIKDILNWLNNLENLLKKYKWSKTIPFEKLWPKFKLRYFVLRNRDVPYKSILTLYGLYNSIPIEEREVFANSVLLQLKPIIKKI